MTMNANKLLVLLIVVSTTAGCAAETSSLREAGSSPIPSPFPSPFPTQTEGSEPMPAGETPEPSTDGATPDVSPIAGPGQPPADGDHSLYSPVEGARWDLARRLQIDPVWVEVVEVTTREPDAEVMSCLSGNAVPEELWTNLDEAQWISLLVKGNVYHYVVLELDVIYCGG